MLTSAPTTCVRTYRPRAAEHTVLHEVVRRHLATFLRAAEEGGGVPAFVERELRQFLTCGVWAKGFARFRCDACQAERLVPFSCRARAVCPSCGGRRMAEREAHLVDRVLPAHDASGDLRFVPAPPPTSQEIARLVATIARRVTVLLRRHGITLGSDESTDEAASEEDAGALAQLAAASVTGRSLLGRTACPRVLHFGAALVHCILRHLGLPTETPVPAPARPPPDTAVDSEFTCLM